MTLGRQTFRNDLAPRRSAVDLVLSIKSSPVPRRVITEIVTHRREVEQLEMVAAKRAGDISPSTPGGISNTERTKASSSSPRRVRKTERENRRQKSTARDLPGATPACWVKSDYGWKGLLRCVPDRTHEFELAEEIGGDVGSRSLYHLVVSRRFKRRARVEQEGGGRTFQEPNHAVEFLSELGPRHELHGTRVDFARSPFKIALPRRLDALFWRPIVEAEDQLVSDACALPGIELQGGFEERFGRGRHDQ